MTLIDIMRRPAERLRMDALRRRWSDPRVDELVAEYNDPPRPTGQVTR